MRMMRRHLLILLPVLLITAVVFCLPRLVHRGNRSHPLAVSAHAGFPVTITDNFGQTVTVARRPERIISLAPSITEILFAIGAGERVAANTSYCDYPPEAAACRKIGGYLSPNLEAITALAPDLVLCDDLNGREMSERLQKLGIPVVMLTPKTLAEVEETIDLIGRAVGETERGAQLAGRLRQRREAVQARTATLPDAQRPRTLVLLSMDDGLYSAGPGSYLDDMLRIAGGRNLAGRATSPWPVLSLEQVTADNPEVIVQLTSLDKKQQPLTAQSALAHFRANRRWRGMAAVRQGRVAVLDNDLATLPGPRMIDGLEAIAAALHPDLFPPSAR